MLERILPRAGIVAAVLALAGVIAFAVSIGAARLDASKLRAEGLPRAAPPSPTPKPLTDVGLALLPNVVTVETERASDEALGTGWLFDNRGDFVTNAHVVEGELSIRITDRRDQTHVGTILGIDQTTDIALVHCSGGFQGTPLAVDTDPLNTVPLDVVALASSRATGQGDLTTETITAVHQDVPLQSGQAPPGPGSPTVYHDMLDLAGSRIYQGNSGGPVLDDDGRVVGIVTLASPSGPEAYAIPVTRVITELRQFAARSG